TDLMTSIMTHRAGSRPRMASRQSTARATHKNPARSVRVGGSNPGVRYQALCATIAAAIIMALSWRAFVQTSYWKDSETLWNHALAVASDNDVADQNLGFLFLQRGDLDSAISHFETALKIRSHNGAAHYDFGSALIENSLASVLQRKGRLNEAVDHYQNAMRLRPGYGDPYLNLGNVLFQQGRMRDAIAQWQKAHATLPKDARFHTALADVFLGAGQQKD